MKSVVKYFLYCTWHHAITTTYVSKMLKMLSHENTQEINQTHYLLYHKILFLFLIVLCDFIVDLMKVLNGFIQVRETFLYYLF